MGVGVRARWVFAVKVDGVYGNHCFCVWGTAYTVHEGNLLSLAGEIIIKLGILFVCVCV